MKEGIEVDQNRRELEGLGTGKGSLFSRSLWVRYSSTKDVGPSIKSSLPKMVEHDI